MFKAIWMEQTDGQSRATLRKIEESDLDPGSTLINVEWSSLNYKDALAITGRSPVIRKFPMIPGIDFAGTVRHCETGEWQAGDRVVLTGWGYGETAFGGMAQMARVDGAKLVRLPDGLSTRTAMAVGTAGFSSTPGTTCSRPLT